MKTRNCISSTAFQQNRHFHGLCLAAAAAAPTLCPPWEPGGTHSHRELRMVQKWRPGSFGPLPRVTNFISEKKVLRVPHFLKTVLYNHKNNCLPELLACKEILSQGLNGFYPLVILSTSDVPYSFYCTNPWTSVKHLIFKSPLVYLGLHFCS